MVSKNVNCINFTDRKNNLWELCNGKYDNNDNKINISLNDWNDI